MRAWMPSLAFLVVALPTVAQPLAPSLLPNGGFEDGAKGWMLVADNGDKGGAIIQEADGNHALSVSGDVYWTASTDYHIFRVVPREEFAGKRLRLRFRARGDQDAYPGLVLSAQTEAGRESPTLYWRTEYVDQRRPLTAQYQTYDLIRDLPPTLTRLTGLSLYNCTRRGTLVLDDISLTLEAPEATPAAAAAPQATPWDSLQFEERDLLELANTTNFLVAEWGRLYGQLLDAERALYYRGATADVASQRRRLEALRKETLARRATLLALQQFYARRFAKQFGPVYTVDEPHRFYWHNNMHGRDLMLSVGRTHSRKPEFAQLERDFTATGAALGTLLQGFGAASPAPAPPPGQPLFGPRFFPSRVLIGLRATQYAWFAKQWLDPDFIQVSNLAEWTFDAQERMVRTPGPYEDEIRAYDLHWQLMGWIDPRVLISRQRPSLQAALAKDPALSEATELGSVGARETTGIFRSLNVFHPMMRDYARNYWQELGALFRDDPRVFCFESMAEPAPMATIDGRVYTFNYTPEAKAQFRADLQQRFKTIAALNAAWGSNYPAFAAIEPPQYDTLQAMAPADLPLIVEWRKFRKRSYADFEQDVAAAYRAGDGGRHPIANRFARMYLNGQWPPDPFDTWRLASTCTDILCTHNCAEGTALDRAELVYYHSLADRLNKPRGAMEYYPLAPESRFAEPGDQYGLTLLRRGANNFWLAMAWDVTTICAWIENSVGYTPGKNCGVWSPTRESGYTLLHDSAGAISLVKSQLRDGLSDAIIGTRVVKPQVAMLAPYDAPLACWPPGQVAAEGQLVHRFLEEQNVDYTCVPEELIVGGQDTLADTKVLIAPYVLWAARPLQEKLLDWVSRGGTLIAVGPFGFWDEYGRPAGTLLRQALGGVPVEPKREGLYSFRTPAELTKHTGVTIETTVPGKDGPVPNLLRAEVGKGRVYVTCDTTLDALLADSKRVLRQAMDSAIGLRTAWSLNGSLYLVTRQARQGNDRFLVAINRSLEQPCEDTVVVRGQYARVTDVALGRLPVPARSGAGVTAVRLRLNPGEGVCLRLGPYQPTATTPRQVQAFLQAETAAAQSQLQGLLAQVKPQAERLAYARAATARDAALALASEGQSAAALEFAQCAADYAAGKLKPPTDTPAAQSMGSSSPRLDNDADWAAAPWVTMEGARFKSQWDGRALYFLLEFQDPLVRNDARPPELWRGDSVEIYLDVLRQGGSRKLGRVDFQYCVAPDGQVQLEGRSVTRARAVGARTAEGYRVAVALPHDETLLVPTPGLVVACNIRVLDYGPRDGAFKFLAERVLKPTGFRLSDNASGWPGLELAETRPTGAPQATYDAAQQRVTLTGAGNTLPSIAAQLAKPALLTVAPGKAMLGAHLHLARGAELILPAGTLSGLGPRWTLTADPGSRLMLRGDVTLANLDAAPLLRACRLTAERVGKLTATATIALRLTDKQGLPVRHTAFGLKLTSAGGSDTVLERRERSDAAGIIRLEVPALLARAELERAVLTEGRYDLYVDDFAVTASYALKDVSPATKTDYALNCGINR